MILEIALGIVVAVLILNFWPMILALGVVAVVLAVMLIVVGFGIYWLLQDPQGAVTIVVVVGCIVLLSWGLGWLSDKLSPSKYKSRKELGYDVADDEPSNSH